MGIYARYPHLDDYTIQMAVEHPRVLIQDGFLEAMQTTNLSLRKDLTELVIKCVTPGVDLGATVQAVHKATQIERYIPAIVIASRKENELLTPLELRRLLDCLETLDTKQIKEYLKQGLIAALDSMDQKKQQRVHTSIDKDQVKERVE